MFTLPKSRLISSGAAILLAVTVLAGCASSPSGVTQDERGNIIGESTPPIPPTVTEGNPEDGVLPLREDGSTNFSVLTSAYPQGKAFLESFRAIFPEFEEADFSENGGVELQNAKEVCGMVYFEGKPIDMTVSVQKRVAQTFPREATEDEAHAVINAALETVCPEFIDQKI